MANQDDRIAHLEDALRPFVLMADRLPASNKDGDICWSWRGVAIRVRDVKAARAALAGEEG